MENHELIYAISVLGYTLEPLKNTNNNDAITKVTNKLLEFVAALDANKKQKQQKEH